MNDSISIYDNLRIGYFIAIPLLIIVGINHIAFTFLCIFSTEEEEEEEGEESSTDVSTMAVTEFSSKLRKKRT